MLHLLKKILPDLQVYVGIAIMVAFSVFAIHKAETSAHSARDSADSAIAATVAAKVAAAEVSRVANDKFCASAVPSWEVRRQLIVDVNEPTHLSRLIDPKSDLGRSLQTQIDQNNAQKAARLKRELALNGAKPCPNG